MTELDHTVNRLANRHVGKALGKLDKAKCNESIKDDIKATIWQFAKDVDNQIVKGNVYKPNDNP